MPDKKYQRRFGNRPEGDTPPGDASYSGRDLRATLSTAGSRISPRRRAVTVGCVAAALGTFLIVPALAQSYNFEGNGARSVGKATNGSLRLWSNALGYDQAFGAGYVAAGYWNLTNGGTGAYCISLSKGHNAADTLYTVTSGMGYPVPNGLDFGNLGYLATNYYPHNPNPVGAMSDRSAEAAATQLAFWEFSDGALDHPYSSTDSWMPGVWARAQQIVADTRANSAGFTSAQTSMHHLTVTVDNAHVSVGQTVNVTATLYDQTNRVINYGGIEAQFNVSGGGKLTSANPAGIDGTGHFHATVIATAPGQINVSATLLNDWQNAAQEVAPSNGSDQNLAFWTHIPRSYTTPAVSTTVAPLATPTPTPVPTATPTAVPTPTPTAVPTATPTATPAPTATPTPTPTATPTPTCSPAPSPGDQPTPTPMPGCTPTPTPTPRPTATPRPTQTVAPTATPTPTCSPASSPGDQPTPTPMPGCTPTPTPTPVPVTCNVPSPVISISGPATFVPGQTSSYAVVAKNGGVAQTSANTVTVTAPAGWSIQNTQPQAAVSQNGASQQAVFTFPTLQPNETQNLIVVVVPPVTATGNASATAVMTSTDATPSPNCPHPSASVQSNYTAPVTTLSSGVQAVTSSPVIQASSPAISTPTTGMNEGGILVRTIGTGGFLLLAGIVVLTGLRRNPHREQ